MNCPIISGLCTCCGANICGFCLQLSVITVSALCGAFLVLKPKLAIDIQINFYKLINWKMEPVSMAKEIRNTRIMGTVALLCSIISLVYIIIAKI